MARHQRMSRSIASAEELGECPRPLKASPADIDTSLSPLDVEHSLRCRLEAAEEKLTSLSQAIPSTLENEVSVRERVVNAMADWIDSRSSKQLKCLVLGGIDELVALMLKIDV